MGVVIVGVAVEQTAYHFDKPFDYVLPEHLFKQNIVGCRVQVPFGRGAASRVGMVMYKKQEESLQEGLKEVADVLDGEPVLNDEMLELGKYISEQNFCPLYDSFKAMLPSGMNIRTSLKYFAAENITQENLNLLSKSLCKLYELLKTQPKGIERQRLVGELKFSPETLSSALKEGICTATESADRKTGDMTVRTARLIKSEQELAELSKITPKQNEVIKLLCEIGAATVKEICYFTGVGESVVKALEKKEIIELYDSEVYRTPEVTAEGERRITLNAQQKAAFYTFNGMMKSGKAGCGLLYGVTGSGKTGVYLKLIDEALKNKKDVIVMVPEISLTPQLLSVFKGRFGDSIAVFHSRLSLGERLDEWKRVKRGEAKIAVGTRSAVFAPLENLGLIIIDEEQEHTYKSEAAPRFHARDAARFRAAKNNALLLLCSATPSIESYAKAREGKYTLAKITKRYNDAPLPKVETVDMREEIRQGNLTMISGRLLSLLEQKLSQHKQSILLLNRRGYNTHIACVSCGKTLTCDNCSISMSYHKANGRLVCHYCGASKPLPERCPECGGEFIKMSGMGTQFAEDSLKKLLPDARILRMDADTTMAKNSHAEKLAAFSRGEYDILIGTQMVAKGLDFEDVDLVGVLNADQAVYNSDFRAYERAFSLLTQVIGRAGRASGEGISVLQTISPDEDIIEMAASQDYDAFFEKEMSLRRVMEYPPFCDICMLGFVSANRDQAESTAKKCLEILQKTVSERYSDLTVRVMGPAPAGILKVGGKFRYRIIIKCKNTKAFRSALKEVLCETGKISGRVTVFADMNPEGIM